MLTRAGDDCERRAQRAPRDIFSPPVRGEPDAGELPAAVGVEEVAVGGTDMGDGGGAGAAAQDELVAHELTVVLAERAGQRLEAGERRVGAARPLPDIAVELKER